MGSKKTDDFATGRYTYGNVERALGVTFGADLAAQNRGALRGRLKHLTTLGLLGTGPGKGTRRLYSLEETSQLLIALLMEDAGLDPVVVVPAVKNTWRILAHNVRRALDAESLSGNPIILTVRLELVGGPWRTGDPMAAAPWIGVGRRIDRRVLAMRQQHGFDEKDTDILVMMFDRDEPGWLAFRNLTAEMRKLYAELRDT